LRRAWPDSRFRTVDDKETKQGATGRRRSIQGRRRFYLVVWIAAFHPVMHRHRQPVMLGALGCHDKREIQTPALVLAFRHKCPETSANAGVSFIFCDACE